jgi:8-oxoguanine deaminase
MATLLAKNADILVAMDGKRRELTNAGLFARGGVIEQVGPTASLPAGSPIRSPPSSSARRPGHGTRWSAGA